MRLSIVIVSYNVSAFLEKCLQSVYKAIDGIDAEVVVVDNHSLDDSVLMVKRMFPTAKVIENERNLGFGAANNIALQDLDSEYVVLLNPDTLVNEDTFRVCIEFMDNHPQAAAVGVRMFDGSGRFLPESKRGFPTPGVALSKMLGLGRLFPKSRTFNGYYLGHLDPDKTHSIDVLTGAFMFMRYQAAREVGFFDEDYFMYGEDIDLSYRLKKAGYGIYYHPDTSIIHYKGESTRKSSLNYLRSFYNAMIVFLEKHFRGARYAPFVFLIKLGVYLRAFLGGLSRLFLFLVPLLTDAILILLAVYLSQLAWGWLYYHNPDHFDRNFFLVNLPLYTGCWLVFLFLAGSYDKYFSFRRHLTGMLLGTLAIVVIYAMLNAPYRSSRPLIFLSGGVAWVFTLVSRYLTHFFRHRSFDLGKKKVKRAIVIASKEEALRILELLNRSQARIRLQAVLSPKPVGESDFFDNDVQHLEELLSLYPVEELIFSAGDIPFSEITRWMNKLGSKYEFKIATETSAQIVGSKSKDFLGELYSVDFEFHLAQQFHRRNKRLLEILVASLIILLSPVILLIFKGGKNYLRNSVQVIRGKMSLIGYHHQDPGIHALPGIKEGVIKVAPEIRKDSRAAEIASIRNMLYAKEYSIWKDLELLGKKWRQLGTRNVNR